MPEWFKAPPVRFSEPDPTETWVEPPELTQLNRYGERIVFSSFAPGQEPDVWPPLEPSWHSGWRGVVLGALLALYAALLLPPLKLARLLRWPGGARIPSARA